MSYMCDLKPIPPFILGTKSPTQERGHMRDRFSYPVWCSLLEYVHWQ